MEVNIKLFLIVFILTFFIGCNKKDIYLVEDLSIPFDKAMKFYDTGKFSRAKDEFEYIIMADPGSKIANQSQYYMAESMFALKEYDEASNIFDRFVKFSSELNKIEKARYRICECAIFLSRSYQRDQSKTSFALEQLQMFIEDFPLSELVVEAEFSILELRLKLAQKDFEVGRMYLKLEEYESALIYFRSVLNNYYDTSFSDDARIGIIFTHILNNNRKAALNYFSAEKERFLSNEKLKEAETLIGETNMGLKLTQYYQLYK